MVIFHGYVSLPEGNFLFDLELLPMIDPCQNAAPLEEASPKVGSCKPGDVDSYAGIIHKDKELAEQLGVVNGFIWIPCPIYRHGIQRREFKRDFFLCNVVTFCDSSHLFFW